MRPKHHWPYQTQRGNSGGVCEGRRRLWGACLEAAAHPQWGLLLDSRCDRLPAVSIPGWSGSGNVLL